MRQELDREDETIPSNSPFRRPTSSQQYHRALSPHRTPTPSQYGTPAPEPESINESAAETKSVIKHAGDLLGRYTLLEEPWPQADALSINVRRFWSEANDHFNTSLPMTKAARSDVSASRAFRRA